MGEVRGKSVEVWDLGATLSLNIGRGGGVLEDVGPHLLPPRRREATLCLK